METSEQIDCPAPLPEDTADALLTEMRTPAPYKVPEKTKKKAKRKPDKPTIRDLLRVFQEKQPEAIESGRFDEFTARRIAKHAS